MTTATAFPANCPACDKPTADVLAAKHPAGRHCRRDNFEDWREKCLVLVCPCGQHYTRYTHHYRKATP